MTFSNLIFPYFFPVFSDEIDVIGYSSNQSDTDDHLSVQSMQSTGSTDSGVIMSASRLRLDTDDMEI
uniref:CSON012513 protein n=1 Tax=Culicoides sonorensis TaxID=179676 RepID=A0A336K612_CULSO